jgi:hypothetical protein
MFGRAIRHAWYDPAFRFLALLASLVLASGTLFFHWAEGWRWLDSLYYSVMTLATVGYGDFTPKTDIGKIFAMVYVFVGIGLLIAVFTRIADSLVKAQQVLLENRTRRLHKQNEKRSK